MCRLQIDGQLMDIQMDKVYRQIGRYTYRQIARYKNRYIYIDRLIDREIYVQIDDRWIYGQMDRQMDRQ